MKRSVPLVILFALLLAFGPLAVPRGGEAGSMAGTALTSPVLQEGKGGEVDNEPDVPTTELSETDILPAPNTPAGHVPAGQAFVYESEPNGSVAAADPLAADAVAYGNIWPVGDADYYSFTASAGDRVYAATQTYNPGSWDTILTLLASDGTTVIESDNDDGSLGSSSSTIAGATIPTAGTYYLQVIENGNNSRTRPYHLHRRVQSGTPVAEIEPNDWSTPMPLPASGWVSGAVTGTADYDVFAFALNAGDTIYLGLDLDPERDAVTFNGVLGIGLFHTNTYITVNDSGTNLPYSEAIFMTVKDAGTYYAYVGASSGASATATYHLNVSVHPPEATGSCTTYSSTDVPKPIGPAAGIVTSTITVPGTPRIADLDATITLTHTSMGDLDVHLISPDNENNNALFNDLGSATYPNLNIGVDDESGVELGPWTVLNGMVQQPEYFYRLGWFDGEDAGGTWTLSIADDTSNTSGGILSGWSLTVCTPPPPPTCPAGSTPTTLYTSDFEADDGGFTHSGTQDEWARGLPAFAPITTCSSGTNCWKTDLTGTYNANSSQDLLSPAINLAGYVEPRVTWMQKYQMESASYDRAYAEAMPAGSAGGAKLWEWLDGTQTATQGAVTIQGSGGWAQFDRSLADLSGQAAQLRFHLDSEASGQYAGYAIDDVTVTACRPGAGADLSIVKSDLPDPVAKGEPLTYTLTVHNYGPDSAADVVVTDNLPAGYVATGATASAGTCNISGQTVTCQLGAVANAADVTITINGAPMTATCFSTLINNAGVTTSSNDFNTANNTTGTTTVVACDQTCATYVSADPPQAIPDNNLVTGVTSTLTVPTGAVIADVNLTGLWISHTYDSDLDIYLAGPVITALGDMSTDNGSSGDNYIGTILDDEAATAVTAGVAPFTGAYRPEQPLAVHDSTNPQGTWTLRVFDDVSSDTGTLNGWGLEVCTAIEPVFSADASVTVTDIPDPVTAGEALTYTFTVGNAGPQIATGMLMSATLPADWNFAGGTVSQGSCIYTVGTHLLECAFGTVAPGATATLDLWGSVAAGATCPGTLSFDTTVASDFGDPNTANNTATTTTAVACSAPAAITVAPPSLALTVTQGTTGPVVQTLTIGNTGGADLTWTITEEVAFSPAGKAGGPAENPGVSTSFAAAALAPATPPANPAAILWDQPLSAVNQNAYVNQDFPDVPTYSSYLADDFVAAAPWTITNIFVPGNGWNGFTTIANATTLTWAVYANNGGIPAGDPSGGGSPPVWSIALAPSNAQVVITTGSGGFPSNVQLNLTTPAVLPAGTYWLVFYPTLPFTGGGQYGRQPADTTNGYMTQFINPGGAFGYGTAWQSWAIIGATQTDMAFRIEGTAGGGTACTPGDIPWLSVSPAGGTTIPGGTTPVSVSYENMGALVAGTYTGNLCVASNDPVNPVVNVPVTLTVRPPTAVDTTALIARSTTPLGVLAPLGLVLVALAVFAIARRRR